MVDVSLTGAVVIVHKSQQILLRDLFRSFVAAFAVIACVMVLMLRSVPGGLIAMAPNLFPTIALFGCIFVDDSTGYRFGHVGECCVGDCS